MFAWTALGALDGQVFAAGSDGDGGSLGLLFFLAGFIFYGIMFMRYRNTDKHHQHAQETEAELANVQASDEFLTKRTRLSAKSIKGANERQVEGAQVNGLFAGLMGSGAGSSARKVLDSFK